ncbi:hypothetical protein D3C71_1859950 [compost metagenome]
MAGKGFQRGTVRGIQFFAVDENIIANTQHAQSTQTDQRITLLQGIVNFIRLIRRLGGRNVQLVT